MRLWAVAALLAVICLGVYWPHRNAEFVLDDYYTVLRNPLIKNPSLYHNIWCSRLFDAHQSSGYISFGYYRPVLQFSWIPDYRLFGLKASGYQWTNLLVHALNCFLVYVLFCLLLGQISLALKASMLFAVLPTQEWVVRYVTGRGDELSALFALASLIFLVKVLKSGDQKGYIFVFLFWVLAALTREVSISYILYAFLIYSFIYGNNAGRVNRFCICWILIGALPFLVISPTVPKQGNILIWHTLYFASIGFCLWMAQWHWRRVVLWAVLFAVASFYQGRYWTTEEALLRHTRSLEYWPFTVVDQQLLMKYDEDVPSTNAMIARSPRPLIKAMWLRRLGAVYFKHGDLSHARQYFFQALATNPSDIDALNALAVISHRQGQEEQSQGFLQHALAINPSYPDTLRTLGIHFFIQRNYPQARLFLSRSLIYDPDNTQARELLGLANKSI